AVFRIFSLTFEIGPWDKLNFHLKAFAAFRMLSPQVTFSSWIGAWISGSAEDLQGLAEDAPMKRRTLTTRTVQTIGDGWHHDQHGLYLQVTANGVGRSWVYRYTMGGKQRYIGLGPAHAIGLAKARELAQECRALRLRNVDPLIERGRQKQ